MLFLSVPYELTPEERERLRVLMEEKTGEACAVLDSGMQVVSIPVKTDGATGGNQCRRAGFKSGSSDQIYVH